jgi:hypothetical protein
MKAIKCLLVLLILLKAVTCFAGDSTVITKSDLTNLQKALNDKIDTAKQAITKQVDSLNNTKESNTIDSSFFNAWQMAKMNPCPLYNYDKIKCKKCSTKPDTVCEGGKGGIVITIIAWLLIAVFLFYAVKFFRTTALCRDESYTYDSSNQLVLRPEKERPYSYARTQLFWWSIIICTCYGIFFALFGHLLPLNPTCIILLGGGLVTQLLGKTIDRSQMDNTSKNQTVQSISTQQNSNDDGTPATKPTRHQDQSTTIDFLTDILSDENGVSIHRLQSVMFNVIYGVAFIGYFINSISCCEYPLIEFEGWQLTLLGISTAGYLGMKATENSKSTEQARVNTEQPAAETAVNTETSPVRNKDNY